MTQQELEEIRSMIAEGVYPQAIFDTIKELSVMYGMPSLFSDDELVNAITAEWRNAGKPLTEDMWTLGTGAAVVAKAKPADTRRKGFGAFRDPAYETLSDAFNAFLSMQPAGSSPAFRGAAQRREPITQLQFGLQQPGWQPGDPSAYRQYLTGGAPLTGQGLTDRLGDLARSLLPESLREGDPLSALRGTFRDDPLEAFKTFALPQLMNVAPAFREGLWKTLTEQYNQARYANPELTGANVANLWGYSLKPDTGTGVQVNYPTGR